MQFGGIIHCPVSALLPYGKGRRVGPDAVARLAKHCKAAHCEPPNQSNHVRGIITYDDLEVILSRLRITRSSQGSIAAKNYPSYQTGRLLVSMVDIGRERQLRISRSYGG